MAIHLNFSVCVAPTRRIYIVGAMPHIAGPAEFTCLGKVLEQINDFKAHQMPTDYHHLLLKKSDAEFQNAREIHDQERDHRLLYVQNMTQM